MEKLEFFSSETNNGDQDWQDPCVKDADNDVPVVLKDMSSLNIAEFSSEVEELQLKVRIS